MHLFILNGTIRDNICAKIINNTQTTIYLIYKWEISNKLSLKMEHITFLMT